MVERRVQIVDLVLHDEGEGFVTATSPALPDFCLVTRRDRLAFTVPDALSRFYEMRGAKSVEVLPIDSEQPGPLSQWAAIIARAPRGPIAIS